MIEGVGSVALQRAGVSFRPCLLFLYGGKIYYCFFSRISPVAGACPPLRASCLGSSIAVPGSFFFFGPAPGNRGHDPGPTAEHVHVATAVERCFACVGAASPCSSGFFLKEGKSS
jgi:hypothetical protein